MSPQTTRAGGQAVTANASQEHLRREAANQRGERPSLDTSLGRRASDGVMPSAAAERNPKQASASPTMAHASLNAGEDGDGDTHGVSSEMDKLNLSGSPPPARVQPPPLNSYPSYDSSNDPYIAVAAAPVPHHQRQQPQHPTVFPQEAAYQAASPYNPYHSLVYYEGEYPAGVAPPGMSLETMHGMPGYPGRPPVPRSNRTSPMDVSPPYPGYAGLQHQQQQPHSGYGRPPMPQGQQVPYGMYAGSGQPQGMGRNGDRRQYGSFNGAGSSAMAANMSAGGYSGAGSGAAGGGGRGRHSRHESMVEGWNGVGRYSAAPSTWTSPQGVSPYFYTPYQVPAPNFPPGIAPSDGRLSHDAGMAGGPSSPVQSYRNALPPQSPKASRAHRTSFSGPSQALADLTDKERERKAYHPQPPARRSDWVMWVGNVPTNTSHEELWKFFNRTVPPGDEPWRGPSSIFLISRSSCAFVNLSSQADLDRAVGFFNGKSLRPQDPRCPRMVCRVRRKDDDLRAGVGAQRGTGMHREWVKAQQAGLSRVVDMTSPSDASSTGGVGLAISVDGARDDTASLPITSPASSVPPSPAILEHPPEGEGRRRDSVVAALEKDQLDAAAAEPPKHRSSHSYASTNSSFLAKHFPKRIFILKSATTAELEQSVKTGTWRTQKHNEPVLDQAFRTSQEVFLIFGANKSGEFFGYAKMIEPIDKTRAASIASSRPTLESSSSLSPTAPTTAASVPGPSVPEADNTVRPKASSHPGHGKAQQEEEERARASSDPTRPVFLLSHSQQRVATRSPNQLTPSEELDKQDLSPVSESGEAVDGPTAALKREDRHTEPGPPRPEGYIAYGVGKSSMSAPGEHSHVHHPRPHTLDRDALRAIRGEQFPAQPIRQAMAKEAQKQQALGSSDRDPQVTSDGVKRKDTVVVGDEKKQKEEELLQGGAEAIPVSAAVDDPEALGTEFKIEWVRVGSLPFGRTRHLRNPWNADREVKVSRDGTEVEPAVGTMLMAEWDKSDFPPRLNASMPSTPMMQQQQHQQQHQHAQYPRQPPNY